MRETPRMFKTLALGDAWIRDPRWLSYLLAGATLGLLDSGQFSPGKGDIGQLLRCTGTTMLVSLTMGVLGSLLWLGISEFACRFPTSSVWLSRLAPAIAPFVLLLSAFSLSHDPATIFVCALPLGAAATIGIYLRRVHRGFGWWMLLLTVFDLWLWADLNWTAKLSSQSSRLAALACSLSYVAFLISAVGSWLLLGPSLPKHFTRGVDAVLASLAALAFTAFSRLIPLGHDSLTWVVALTAWLALLPLARRAAAAIERRLRQQASVCIKIVLALFATGTCGLAVAELTRTGASPIAGPPQARLTTSLYAHLLSPEERLSRFTTSLNASEVASPFLTTLPSPQPALVPPPQTILLITVDALRADRVERIAAPPLLQDSLNFTRAYAASSSTLLSLPAMLGSQYPSQLSWKPGATDADHRIFEAPLSVKRRVWTWPIVAKPIEGHLAALLGNLGYHAHAILSGGYTHFFDSQAGFEDGFDTHLLLGGDRNAKHPGAESSDEKAVRSIGSFLREKEGRRLFIWLHLFAPHFPYPDDATCNKPIPYDCDIEISRTNVSTVLDSLRENRRYEQALIILSSDHGHSLGDNGVGTPKSGKHAVGVYDAQIRVPLLLKLPGGSGGKTDVLASTVDIAPTVLAAVGAKPHPSHLGVDLRSLAAGSVRPSPVFFEQWQLNADGTSFTERWVGAVSGRHKVFIDERRGRLFEFSILDDPQEAHNRLRSGAFAPTPEGASLLRKVLAFRRATAQNAQGLPQLAPR